jgi:hypothetical protein
MAKRRMGEAKLGRPRLMGSETMRYPRPPRFDPQFVMPPHRMADFQTLPELVRHEGDRNGATHVLVVVTGVWIFYPIAGARGFQAGNRQYGIGQPWQERGYWHAPAPEARRTGLLSPSAEPIQKYIDDVRSGKAAMHEAGGGRRPQRLREYIAVNHSGRLIGGPFKDYSAAKREADRAGGYVQFSTDRPPPARRHVAEEASRKPPRTHRPAPRRSISVMDLANKLANEVKGSRPKAIEGGHRWSDKNESAYFVTHSPEYGQVVVVLVSVFEDGTVALDFFSSERMSESDRYENIAHFLYGPPHGFASRTIDTKEMVGDIRWVWRTVDEYAASWEQDEVSEHRPAPHMLPPGPSSSPLLLPPGPAQSARRPPQRSPSARRRAPRK